MINANGFYESSLAKQREFLDTIIAGKIRNNIADPVISLDFDVYPVIIAEMNEAGWGYESYYNIEEQQKCARFYPKQYKPE